MNLAAWAERNGVARVTACRWFHAGRLSVPAQRVGRLILVRDAMAEPVQHRRTAVYARVWSAEQKAGLDRQVARVAAWATSEQIPVDEVVTEVGSALIGHRRKFLALLRDPTVSRIVVEHRDPVTSRIRSSSRGPRSRNACRCSGAGWLGSGETPGSSAGR